MCGPKHVWTSFLCKRPTTAFLFEGDQVQQDCPMSKIKRRDVLKVKVCFRTLVFEKERLRISINEINKT